MMMTGDFVKTPAQREAVKLLSGPALHTLLYGGSRSGKTFITVYKIVCRALNFPGSRHCILRRHSVSVSKSIVADTFPSVMAKCFPHVPYTLNKSLFFARFPNGSEIWFGGLDASDKILGNEYATIYFNECSEMSFDQLETAYSRCAQKVKDCRNRFFYDCNPAGKAHWSYRLFIEGVNPADRTALPDPGNYCCMRINPTDNAANLPDAYLDTLRSLSRRKRMRFLDGEWADDAENALWKRDTMISAFRVTLCPPETLDRIVVAIDPAVTSNAGSDLTGIVVAGVRSGEDGEPEYFVLADLTIRATPAEWARTAVDAYWRYQADRIVAEVNNGGDLVESTIRNADYRVSFRSVRATRGKILRAEPISALYERGKVHHVGEFPELEDQMCGFTGSDGEKSPDRLDALVWALTDLSGADSGGGTVSAGPEMAFTY